ncbi:DUF3806 domain-containing protein [Haliea sp. E1-2-M8]|uniref:DUF3806 domain-containing protein n=1 Tax=Haliea sp. E1-2-M8 TaxID=3064706 RepID=UPI002724DFB0|nr:DUF3806 domain-containing protein [Haliea sp. E1-2-M8]MDO8861464.1 DUF3806 domain-containing protein [Haliea sp. E1-2-M8]
MRDLPRMPRHRATRYLLSLLILLAVPVSAQDRVSIGELSDLDRGYMTQQRASIDDIARRQLGQGFTGQKDRDLDLLQRILDRDLVRPDQIRELQAMGLILGDLLAEELGMHWVVYEDKLGRSRALRYRETDNYLFPMTMISRRQEAANQTSVREIYQSAVDAITPYLTPLPFQ